MAPLCTVLPHRGEAMWLLETVILHPFVLPRQHLWAPLLFVYALSQVLYFLHLASVGEVLYMKFDRLNEMNTIVQCNFHSEIICENSFLCGPHFCGLILLDFSSS